MAKIEFRYGKTEVVIFNSKRLKQGNKCALLTYFLP